MAVVAATLAAWVALALAAAGSVLVSRPKSELVAIGLGFLKGLNPATVKLIGAAELVGALGLVLVAADVWGGFR